MLLSIDLTGQAYRDTSNVFEIASVVIMNQHQKFIISTQYKSYANIDGTVTMLSWRQLLTQVLVVLMQ